MSDYYTYTMTCFTSRHRLLTERLIKQGYKHRMLCVSFKKFCHRHGLIFPKFMGDLGNILKKEFAYHWVMHVTIRGRK